MKTKLILFSFFLLVAVVFHKQLIGFGVRMALQSSANCQLVYRGIQWEKGELVFSDVVISDPTFHAHIQKAALDICWDSFPKKLKGHLTLHSPHVSVMTRRDLPEKSESWFDFTVSAVGGTVEWDGLARFAFDPTHLSIDWGDSGGVIYFNEEGIEVDLRQFKAKLLQPWAPFGQILEGQLTGRISADLAKKLTSVNVKIDQVSFALPEARLQEVSGSVSYNAHLGLKWELQGAGVAQGKQFPIVCDGRGFFKSHWIESEIQFGEASCKVSGEGDWEFECEGMKSEQVALLQACVAPFWPEFLAYALEEGCLNLRGHYHPENWHLQFDVRDLKGQKEGVVFACQKAKGSISADGGELAIVAPDFDVKLAGKWEDWKGEARIGPALMTFVGGWDGEKFPVQIQRGSFQGFDFLGKGWIDSHLDFAMVVEGNWTVFEKKIPFSGSQFAKKGDEYSFDFRFVREMWDLARLKGSVRGLEVCFSEKSHLFGAPLYFGPSTVDQFEIALNLPWTSVLAAHSVWREWRLDLSRYSVDTELFFQYKNGRSDLRARGINLPFQFHAVQEEEDWKVDLVSDLNISGSIGKEGNVKGKGKWKSALEVEFDGKVTPNFRCEFFLSKVVCDLSQLDLGQFEGILEGQGHVVYNGTLESDFDVHASALKIYSHAVENEGPMHVSYASSQGILFRGLNLHGPFDCIIDLLEYDIKREHWIFHDSQMHLPGSFLTHNFLKFLSPEMELNFTADLDFASDFSTFTCTMREGNLPIGGKSHHIEDLHLQWHNGQCKAALHYLNHPHFLSLNIGEKIQGRCILGNEETPLTIDWEYQDELLVHSIEGSFGGIEASFHEERPNVLVGSARINFTELCPLIPADVARGFYELKMGKGYEIKGQLRVEKNTPYFSGILCGKAIEFFGYQFRTLLAQINFHPQLVDIYDLKISDSAGMMKVDQILLETQNGEPWLLHVPEITIVDLRPSFLQKPGQEVGPITPLVIRELKLKDLKGLAAEANTYTAAGFVHFINSYKREETVFDKPANMLSRIVGLDLELLIPVCGDLTFDLKDGWFHLNELTHSYSEAERSEFFLETDPPPRMDLDGNLQIGIKMKQFVLFKITESFIISIEGQLNDPKFHLRKKRFFGFL